MIMYIYIKYIVYIYFGISSYIAYVLDFPGIYLFDMIHRIFEALVAQPLVLLYVLVYVY